jgi:hypothetical protein
MSAPRGGWCPDGGAGNREGIVVHRGAALNQKKMIVLIVAQ